MPAIVPPAAQNDVKLVTAQRVKVVQIQALGIHKNAKKTSGAFICAKMGTAAKTEYSST